MEDPIKQQPPLPETSGKLKQRFALRSATRLKEEKAAMAESLNSTAPKRGRPASTVSKSVSVLDLSGKEKSAKPPRRLSIPAKSTANSISKVGGNITPISEARMKRSGQGKSDTPVSDISKSASRKRFSVLSSASYWLSQIKLSESASKHSISLGFFKLALEAGCEPPQRMKDELKSYFRRHNLVEHGELLKELLERYNISETLEQLQVSESFSQGPEESTRSSDDDVHSSSSTMGTRKLKPKSLNIDSAQVSSVSESVKKDTAPKTNSAIRTRGSLRKNVANSKSVSDAGTQKIQKRPQKPKQELKKEMEKINKQGIKVESGKGPVSPLPAEDTLNENKENMDAPPNEDISAIEAI